MQRDGAAEGQFSVPVIKLLHRRQSEAISAVTSLLSMSCLLRRDFYDGLCETRISQEGVWLGVAEWSGA